MSFQLAAGDLLKMLAELSDQENAWCLSCASSSVCPAFPECDPASLHYCYRNWELYGLLGLSLAFVKWYDGKMRLFLFFSHLHIDNRLKSREKLRLIRIEIHRKDITFRFENTLGKGF